MYKIKISIYFDIKIEIFRELFAYFIIFVQKIIRKCISVLKNFA